MPMSALRVSAMMAMFGSAAASVTPDNSIMCLSYSTTPVIKTTTPSLAKPQDIAVDGAGDVFVVDEARQELIRIDGADGNSAVLLGPEILEIPIGLAISPVHSDLYIGDENTSTVWLLPCMTRNTASCSEYYSTPLNISLSSSVHPMGLQLDMDDHLYIADFAGHRVMKRDSTTGNVDIILDDIILGIDADAPADQKFGPMDVAIDLQTHEVLVTDLTNDDIWGLKCQVPDPSGQSCDAYNDTPYKFDLTGTVTGIQSPSGIAVNLQSTIFVTGQFDGVVAEIKGSNAVDLLQESDTGSLHQPVALGFDYRYSSKSLWISEDFTNPDSGTQGLYELPCATLVCVPLSTAYVSKVSADTQTLCTDVPVGNKCDFACADGYYSNASQITCGPEGWDTSNVVCGVDTSTASIEVGAAVAVAIVLLVVLAVALFVFIRMRQRKGTPLVRTSGYSPFGTVAP